jgi:hypothetical protein
MEIHPHFPIIRSIFTQTSRIPLIMKQNTTNKKSQTYSITNRLFFLKTYRRFFLLGIISEIIYLLYLLHNFPLTHYFQSGKSDMGSMSGYSHAGFLTYVMVFSLLFVIFGLAWLEAFRFQDRLFSALASFSRQPLSLFILLQLSTYSSILLVV